MNGRILRISVYLALAMIVAIFAAPAVLKLSIFLRFPGDSNVVQAEDDEEDEEDEDKEDDSDDEDEVRYETRTIRLPDTIQTKTITVVRQDRDADGMYDDEDPHPDINEYIIVKDENLNGIDDRYEY